MASWYTDYSEYTTGVKPSDWTEVWSVDNSEWVVREKTGLTGGKCLEHTATTTRRRCIIWDDIGNIADIDVVASIRTSSKTHYQNGIAVRVSGNYLTENCYVLSLTTRANQGYDILLAKNVNGSTVNLVTTVDFDWAIDTLYSLRLQVIGTAIKCKYWLTSGSEPTDWQISTTDVSITTGNAGYFGYTITGIRDFDTFYATEPSFDVFMESSVLATSTTIGNLDNIIVGMQASVGATSTTIGNLTSLSSHKAIVSATSSIIGNLTNLSSFKASVLATSIILDDLKINRNIVAVVSATSTITENLTNLSSLKASVLATSIVSADLKINKNIVAEINSQSEMSVNLTVDASTEIFLVGVISATSTIIANIAPDMINLSSTVLATSSTIGNLISLSSHKAIVSATSTTTGNLTNLSSLKASVLATSIVSADLKTIKNIVAVVSATSIILDDLKINKNIVAEIVDAISQITGNLIQNTRLVAEIYSVSETIANLLEIPIKKMFVAQIAEYLMFKNLGIFDEIGTSGDIYILTQPSAPNNCIAIYPRGGPPSDSKLGYDTVNIELLIRGDNPIVTFERSQLIYNLMHGMNDRYFVPLGFYVVNCMADQSGPNYIGKDDNKRFEFSLNFTIEIKNFDGNRDNGDT